MALTRIVYIEGSDVRIERMFIEEGWSLSADPSEANLICFSGGEDVSPMLYNEVRSAHTNCNPIRDEKCSNIFYEHYGNIPMVGICRGAQYLNVMSGGSMIQHIESHIGSHNSILVETGEIIEVTSTHHQMMNPDRTQCEVLLVASEFYEDDEDIEAVYYEETNSLCYQPHPEYVDEDHPCRKLFFELIEIYLYG